MDTENVATWIEIKMGSGLGKRMSEVRCWLNGMASKGMLSPGLVGWLLALQETASQELSLCGS